jgi:hypothetical protein
MLHKRNVAQLALLCFAQVGFDDLKHLHCNLLRSSETKRRWPSDIKRQLLRQDPDLALKTVALSQSNPDATENLSLLCSLNLLRQSVPCRYRITVQCFQRVVCCNRVGALGDVRIDIRRDRQPGGGGGDVGRRQQVFITPMCVGARGYTSGWRATSSTVSWSGA